MPPRASPPASSPRTKGEATRERILVTAERLFAERGIEGVSVRSILAEAGVNAALANRHFGGRDGLVAEVLRRALGPLDEERQRLLAEVEARGDRATVEDVLRALFAPGVRWLYAEPDRARLLAQLQTSNDPALRAMHTRHFDAPLQRFAEALVRTTTPHLGPREFVARFTLAHGALQAVYRHGLEVARIARERLGPGAVPSEADWIDELVAFCAAGFRAKVANPTEAPPPPGAARSPRRRNRR
jgi:AcrR family transcriptional regulator